MGDIEHVALNNTVSELVSEGISAIGIPVDVSDIDSLRSFRDEVISEFTPPYIVCLNAGVGAGGSIVDSDILDWEWVLGGKLVELFTG